MVFHLLCPGIHARLVSYLQSYTGKSLGLAQEEFLLSSECFFLAAVFYLLAELVGYIEKQEDMPKHSFLSTTTMELPSFAIGRPRHESKRQRIERLRKENEWNRKKQKQKQKQKRTVPLCIAPKRPLWLILPTTRTKGLEFWIVTMGGDTFFSKKQTLLEDIERMKQPQESPWTFDSSLHEKYQKDFLEKAETVMGLLAENQRIRWIFKRFVTRIRIQSIQTLNDTDPVTLEPIREPVQFSSFSKRKRYMFEAEAFAKHIHKKLLHNDGQIPMPLYPKNPYTNEEFTTPQIMGLVNQCRKYGHSSWAMEAFVSCRYDLLSFVAIHSKPLRLHALRETMKHVTGWDAIDTLYDFVKSQHAHHDECFYSPTYIWAITHVPHEKRIESWRKLCIKWYETDILIDDLELKGRLFAELETKTLPLCEKPTELQALKLQKQKQKKISATVTDGSSSI